MKVGDVVENSVWLTGAETQAEIDRYVADVEQSIVDAANEQRAIMAPPEWSIKRPGDDHVPKVPDHIAGPDVRLLVVEARIVARMPDRPMPTRGLAGDFDKPDLAAMRAATRQGYAKSRPGALPLTDDQCDVIINELGEETVLDELRRSRVH